MNYVDEFRRRNEELKRALFRDAKYTAFGVDFSRRDDYSKLEDKDLTLRHSILHACFGRNNPTIPKQEIIFHHKRILEEMKIRKKTHKEVDGLDREV